MGRIEPSSFGRVDLVADSLQRQLRCGKREQMADSPMVRLLFGLGEMERPGLLALFLSIQATLRELQHTQPTR